MKDQAVYDSRLKNILDASSFREPERIPVGLEVLGWPFAYAGTTLRAARDNPKQAIADYLKFFEEIEFDWTWTVGINVCEKVFSEMGIPRYKLADDDTTIQHIQVNDVYMPKEDYPKFIADPAGYRHNHIYQKTFPEFSAPTEQTYQKMLGAAKALRDFNELNDGIRAGYSERNIVNLAMPGSIFYYAPFNTLFDAMRGIPNSLSDLRRCPEAVLDACDALWEREPLHKMRKAADYADMAPINVTIYHSECFLNDKWFDRLFMHYLKDGYGPMFDRGAKFFLKGEGSFMRTTEYWRQFPKGALMVVLDEDDPFEFHERYGDWVTICCGITADLLKFGSKQQCIDYVKRCVDTFAPGGGFMFMPNKPQISAADAKIENLVAAFETINTYGRK